MPRKTTPRGGVVAVGWPEADAMRCRYCGVRGGEVAMLCDSPFHPACYEQFKADCAARRQRGREKLGIAQ